MKLLESNKFIIFMGISNLLVIFILVGGILHIKHSTIQDTQGYESDMENSTESNGMENADYKEADDSLSNIYMSLVENTHAELDGGISYNFEPDGKFSGYFDVNSPKVEGYTYRISMDGDDIVLTICNKEETQFVQYALVIMENGQLALDYPDFKKPITLTY